MNAYYTWHEGYHATLKNRHGHPVDIDLPADHDGTNMGPTAYELLGMSLAGCIGTIFMRMAGKMHLGIASLSIELTAEEDNGDIASIDYTCHVRTSAGMEQLSKCLDLTERTCPVGKLFHRAGIPFSHRIVVEA